MKKNVEYQLTPKGEELSKKMDQKNTDVVVEIEKIKNHISKKEDSTGNNVEDNDIGIDDEGLPLPGEPMSYQQAKKIKKKSFGTLLAEQEGGLKESFKKALSLKTQAKVKGIKEKFDPMNIVKFMSFGSNFAPAMLGKLTGRSKEDIANFTGAKAHPVGGGGGGDTATKIGSLQQDTQMLDILMKIYTLMDKTHQEDIKRREEMNQFADENLLEKEKKRKELLAALKGKKDDKEEKKTEKLENDTGMGVGGILGSILDAAGGLKSVLSIASMFMGPVGIALLAGTGIGLALVGLMSLAGKDSHEQASKVSGAADVTSEGQAITDVVKDTSTIERRKQNILADRPWSKKSLVPWKDPELQQKYLDEIGWDDSTGLTKAEKAEGFTGLDEKGIPVKKESSTQKSSAVNQSGTFADVGENPNVLTAATPTESPNVGGKLNSVTKENVNLNLAESTSDPSSVISNNSVKTYAENGKKIPMPSVRNLEPTFQNMIVYSTRVV